MGVDLTIDEVVMIASVTATANSAKSALNWIVGRCVGDKPGVATVISRRHVKVPNPRKIHALIIGEVAVVRRTEERDRGTTRVASSYSWKYGVVNAGKRANIHAR